MQKIRSCLVAVGMVLALMTSGGCAVVLLGAGAAGGYAVAKDTIQGTTDQKMARVWQVAERVAKDMGQITKADKGHGVIDVVIDEADVRITLEQLTEETVQIRVKSRKFLLPNLELAEKVYTKIIKRVD